MDQHSKKFFHAAKVTIIITQNSLQWSERGIIFVDIINNFSRSLVIRDYGDGKIVQVIHENEDLFLLPMFCTDD